MNLKNLTIYFLFAFILFELTECVGDEKGKKEDDKGKEVAKTLKPKRRRESSRKSELIGQSSSTGGATEELNIDPLNINQEVQHFINILQQSEYQNARKNNVEKRKFKEENKRIEKELLDRKDESFLFLKKIKNMAKQNTKETKNFFDEKRKELNKLLNEGKNVEEGQPIKKQKRQKEKGISFKEQSSITSKGKEHVSGKGKAKDGISYSEQSNPQQHGMQNIPPIVQNISYDSEATVSDNKMDTEELQSEYQLSIEQAKRGRGAHGLRTVGNRRGIGHSRGSLRRHYTSGHQGIGGSGTH